ncbi:MAG: PDZ domain-containing protein, partial [Gemmatimonadetes bacterium]|nr:PDZ domain-containing protein [Gemmatimonadota bacterium]
DRLAVAPRANTRTRRVSLGTIPDFARESGGILLSGVMPDSPAAGAGLEKGDLITAIDGGSIDTMADFQAALAGHEPGDAIDVTFSRGEATKIVRVTLAERKH